MEREGHAGIALGSELRGCLEGSLGEGWLELVQGPSFYLSGMVEDGCIGTSRD